MILSDYCTNENGAAILKQPIDLYLHDDIVSNNADVIRQLNLIERTAKSDAPVIIEGEKGTGKEHFAQYAYSRSLRYRKQYNYFNCASFARERFETELFGSDTPSYHEGLLARTNGGTLFINDINLLPHDIQNKLLGAVAQYGNTTGEPPFDIRLIGSCTRNENNPVQFDGLTEELYYYISIIRIQIPPLRRRREDILLLAMFFLDQINNSYGINRMFSWDVLSSMIDMDWPGNIRQLKYTVERMAWLTEGDLISNMSLLAECAHPMGYAQQIGDPQMLPEIRDNDKRSLKALVSEYERMIIRQYIKKYGSLRKAAKVLQVAPASLSRKLNAEEDGE